MGMGKQKIVGGNWKILQDLFFFLLTYTSSGKYTVEKSETINQVRHPDVKMAKRCMLVFLASLCSRVCTFFVCAWNVLD